MAKSMKMGGVSGGSVNETLPQQVTNFKAKPQKKTIVVSWENPTEYWKGTLIVRKASSAPQGVDDGEEVYNGTGTTFTDINVEYDTKYFYRAYPYNSEEQYQAEYLVTNATPVAFKTMTVIIDQSNSNPETCCTYADDAVDMVPGSEAWDEFFGHYPCLFKNGQEVGKLQRNNFDLFEDGSPADISSGNAGDAMICFPRRGLRISTSGDRVTISMTDARDSSEFEYLAHTRGQTQKNKFYIGAYIMTSERDSNYNITKVQSLKDKQINSRTGFTKKVRNSIHSLKGNGYDMMAFYQYVYIQAMFLLKYKTTNSRKVLGAVTYSSSSWQTGETLMSGMDHNGSEGPKRSKLFGIEEIGPTRYDTAIDGFTFTPDNIVKTATDSFNDSGTGYINSGIEMFPPGENFYGFYDKVVGTSKLGFIPRYGASGSSSTYYCDYAGYGNYNPAIGRISAQGKKPNIQYGLFSTGTTSTEASELLYRLMYL